MKYKVLITEEAEKDIVDIWSYIMINDCIENADYVVDSLEGAIGSLWKIPQKGHVLPELERISVFNYLEIHFKPYRIIYQIDGSAVYIYCVIDGRRDIHKILERRLLKF
jgi:toxin ParE1/3/4